MSECGVRQPTRPAIPPTLYAFIAAMISAYAVMSTGGMGSALRELIAQVTQQKALLGIATAMIIVFAALRQLSHRLAYTHSQRGSMPTHDSGQTNALLTPYTSSLNSIQKPLTSWKRGWSPRPLACSIVQSSIHGIPFAPLLGVAILAASLSAQAALTRGNAFIRAIEHSQLKDWDLTVITDPTKTDRGTWRCRVRATQATAPSGDLWLTTEQACEIGDILHINSGFIPNSDDEWGRINRSQGMWGTLLPKANNVLRVDGPQGFMQFIRCLRDAARNVIQPYSSESRAVLAGCVIGDRRAMDEMGLSELFSACGVSHLIAVSGGHIVIMAQVLALLLDHTRLNRKFRIVLLVALSGLYVLLTGAPIPAVRSWFMAIVCYGSQLAGRRSDALAGAALVGLCMVLLDPAAAGQIGFLLSVICVTGLTLMAEYATYALKTLLPTIRKRPNNVPKSLWRTLSNASDSSCETLAATIVAQLATMPVTIPLFMQVSLVAPLANLALTVPLTILIAAGIIAACLPLPMPVASLVLKPCDLVAEGSLCLLRQIASIPFATIPFEMDNVTAIFISVTLVLILLITWPKLTRQRTALFLCIVCITAASYIVRWSIFAPARIVIFDIGQGDAILIQDGSTAALIDAGPDEEIRKALARNHVLRLDTVILTHLHDDHYGGVMALPGYIGVRSVLVAEGVTSSSASDPTGYNGDNLCSLRDAITTLTGRTAPREISYGDTISVGNFALEVIWPQEAVSGSKNAESLELYAKFFDGKDLVFSALLTGDAERDETARAVTSSHIDHIDLLKVGHHGSAVSLDEATAGTLAPLVAVASAGENNRYGHPKEECVQLLNNVGSRFFCTKDMGDICIMPDKDGIRVSCCNP